MVQLRALLLTDVVDSTRLARELGDVEMARCWVAHDRAARELLPVWRGREIDKADGMLLLFESAVDAIGYARAYHRALRERKLAIVARAGLHLGPVTLRENNVADVALGAKPLEIEGLAKSVVARVMSVAAGGQTVLSAAARAALPDNVPLHALGHWRLGGIDEPAELFALADDDAPFALPADREKAYRVTRDGELWKPVREVPHSMPAERDGFVGRVDALRALARRLDDDGVRLVSVLGVGGAGKTRLALRCAWGRLGEYPGGIWFCDVSRARDLDGLVQAVARGLDVALGRADPVVHLGRAIAGRGRCLVILDNFEQVARLAEDTLGAWLDRAAQARFLVTTRELLGIAGEQAMVLGPLARSDAMALFGLRAAAAGRALPALGPEHSATEQLVGMLDGLPLAIELAAARLRAMSPQAMLARMHERFSVLMSQAGRRDRQATLRATFDWSWELLPPVEKSALAQLSVFSGGFGVESAAAVLALPSTTRAADVVSWLVDKSLVRHVGDDRFDLLESVRAYAAEHFCTPGRFDGSGPALVLAAEARHAEYFAALGPKRAIEHACIELDNLVRACRWAVAQGEGELAARLLRGASAAIELRGPFRTLQELAESARALSTLDSRSRLEVTLAAASAHVLCGASAPAASLFEAAVALARDSDGGANQARAYKGLADLRALAGQASEAERLYGLALAAARSARDAYLECRVLNGLGAFHESHGRFDLARQSYEQALQTARGGAERRWEGGSAGNLGSLLANLGHADEASALYALAIDIARELGDRQWEANARCNLGLLHFAQGRLGAAQAELDSSLSAARELGHARLAAVVRCNLGLVADAAGRLAEAEQHQRAAVLGAREIGDSRSEGQFLNYLGLVLAKLDRFDEARAKLANAQELLEAQDDRLSLAILHCHRAETEHLAGNPVAASQALASAERLAVDLPDVGPNSELGEALQRVRASPVIAEGK
ncbi:MAG: tetratricopeptide repeat protein [Burkholderiales bacterium]|nr:tetratricopeptide repeat protein [Burkholderiales bacterium]